VRAKIAAIEYFLPKKIVTNADLRRENPSWDMDRVAQKSGVLSRHIAAPNETAFDLAAKACARLFARIPGARKRIDAVICCTQTPDYPMPSNAFLLHKHLGLAESVLAFDYNLACSGYVYGLAIANSLIVSKTAENILLVTGDTYSKLINPRDRSTRVLFGDGAAASLITASKNKTGVIDSVLWTSGKNFDKFIVPAGGCRLPASKATAKLKVDASGNARSQNNIAMDGMGVWSFIQETVPRQLRELLKRNHLKVSDVDAWVFHQASQLTLDSLVKIMALDPSKVVYNLARVGNTVSASIPIALKDAMTRKKIRGGDRVILSGFGVGLSCGACLVQF
jgi:3-oxoacyl-[acyl-carrier-protein] synthase-3